MVEISLLYDTEEYEIQIKELLQICLNESQFIYTGNYIEEQYAKLLYNLKNNSAKLIVAICNHKLLGMAWIYNVERITNKRMHIAFVAVLPIAQKKGVGNLIIEKIKEIAIKNDIFEIDLNVSSSNASANCFYKKMGFIEESISMAMKLVER